MFTHVDENNQPTMVDVGNKASTYRTAKAYGVVIVPEEVMCHFNGTEITTKKGPVFQSAIIAGTMAAKKTSNYIPFCHPLAIEGCKINIQVKDLKRIEITCEVSLHHKTGVEMEALTGVSVAALTIYDMCKALSHAIEICQIQLLSKTGGKSDFKN